jgi:hypothetical protein
MNANDLSNAEETWECLDGELNADSSKSFVDQFKKVFSCQKAKEAKGVVYVWVTTAAVPRLRGKSNILYIGKTMHSLFDRYHRWAETEGNKYNWHRYRHIIGEYGPIKVFFSSDVDAKMRESELLARYYDDHCEYPPVNRTST